MDSRDPTESTEPEDSVPTGERSDVLIKVLVPIAVALILIAAGLAERGPARRDLHLVAPRQALAGQTIPLRAHLLDLRDTAPAPIADATVRVVLRGLEGEAQEAIVRTDLVPTERFGYEGALTLPERSGTFQLFATAQRPGDEDEEPDEARRRITIGSAARPAARRGRLQTALQRYELGARSGSAPPEHLEPRVVGGDCTNHAPCELLVWVGDPPASIALAELSGAREPSCERAATSGFVRCRVSVRGNEAHLTVVASRGGAEVGRRRIQLPMGSPAPALRRERALVPVGHRPVLEVAGLDERYVVDFFHEGRWMRTGTLAPDDGHVALPWALDAPGLWRVQVRRDAFGVNTAAVTTFFAARDPGPAALGALARHPLQNEWMDPTAAAVRAGELECSPAGPWCSPERIAAFMLAAGELEVVTYPRSSSGAEQASVGIRTVQWSRRGAAAGLIFLAGLLVAFVVHRRGTAAGAQARQILASAREETAEEAPERRRDVVPAASAAFLVLIFSVVAAIILARGCLVG